MVVPTAHRARVLRSDASRADPARDIALLGSPSWAASARVLKSDARSSVLMGEHDGRPIVVKSVRLDRPKDAISRVLGTTRGMRQWRGAERLQGLGLSTPKPLLLWRGRDAAGAVVEAMAMEAIEGTTLIQHLADRDLDAAMVSAAVKLLARDIATMIDARLYNRDHKLSNLMLQQDDGAARIWILDTVAIRAASPIEGRRSMMFSLLVEAIGCGVGPGARVCIALQRELAILLRLSLADRRGDRRAVAGRLDQHGGPSPRVNPLRV